MTKFGFIFPGQGAQKATMGHDLYLNSKAAKEIFEIADNTLGRKISSLCFEGPDEELKKTINAQSAILAVEISALEAFREMTNIRPSYVAGHSLGEYAALYCANVLSASDVFLTIQKRSELMDEASNKTKGTMAAVLGLDSDIIKNLLKDAEGYVDIANYNEKNQTVITGDVEAVNKFSEILKQNGARKVVPLAVSGGFHSKLMEEASSEFREYVKNITLNDAKIPVITNVDAKITSEAQDFGEKMPKQISSSVFWYQSIENMLNSGVDAFIEFGPGKVLAGLNKKICADENIKTYNVFDIESLNETIKSLNL